MHGAYALLILVSTYTNSASANGVRIVDHGHSLVFTLAFIERLNLVERNLGTTLVALSVQVLTISADCLPNRCRLSTTRRFATQAIEYRQRLAY
jgi:hypothetical protein